MSSMPDLENFDILPSRETITPDEIPKIAARVGSIIFHAAQIYMALQAKNPALIASHTKNIVEDIIAIKRMLED